MKKTVILLILAAALTIMAACSKGNDPDPSLTIMNIATYEATAADGSLSTFTFTDSKGDLITLSANWKAPESLQPGQRVLLTYTTAEYDVSGPIELIGVMALPGGDIVEAEPTRRSEPLQDVAIARSGNYVDLRATVSFAGNAGEISLYAPDPDAQEPTLYAVITADPDAPVMESAPRVVYASWNLESVEGLADKDALKVVYTDYAGRPQTLTLTTDY